MDPLDEFELRAFEHLDCTVCAEKARKFIEAEMCAGRITLDDIKDMEIEVTDAE